MLKTHSNKKKNLNSSKTRERECRGSEFKNCALAERHLLNAKRTFLRRKNIPASEQSTKHKRTPHSFPALCCYGCFWRRANKALNVLCTPLLLSFRDFAITLVVLLFSCVPTFFCAPSAHSMMGQYMSYTAGFRLKLVEHALMHMETARLGGTSCTLRAKTRFLDGEQGDRRVFRGSKEGKLPGVGKEVLECLEARKMVRCGPTTM